MRNGVRYENIDPVNDQLPDDLFRNVEKPAASQKDVEN